MTAWSTDGPLIRPGKPWLDSSGKRIHAHGGSILAHPDGTFYWYGENKEHTTTDSSVWHWGVRAYASTDLVTWEDKGLIIPPVIDDPESPLHPAQWLDRPHVIRNPGTGTYVCWLKIMNRVTGHQESTVLVAHDFLGPYRMVRTGLRPHGMDAGDFDLAVDPVTGRGYYFYERVHTALICAELSDDFTTVEGEYSSHFPHAGPPDTREAPAYFVRDGVHHLITSGTTGYSPNRSEIASAPSPHGPWTVLGDPHPGDATGTSFHSQVSAVFRHPGKRDLYIALADRWIADGSGATLFPLPTDEPGQPIDTSIADYVWLPLAFDGPHPVIEWRDAWHPDDFE